MMFVQYDKNRKIDDKDRKRRDNLSFLREKLRNSWRKLVQQLNETDIL